MKLFGLIVLLVFTTSCMSTKVLFSESWNSGTKPSYTDHFDQYLLGFAGESTVNVQRVCMDQKPHALQRVKTAEDVALTVITLGIYAPVTVKIWCGE